MDARAWAQTEEAFALGKMDSVRDAIISTCPPDTGTQIGMIYLAIGRNYGINVSRFVILVPFFSPGHLFQCSSLHLRQRIYRYGFKQILQQSR